MRTQLLVLVLGALGPIACDSQQDDEGLFCMNRLELGEDPYRGEMSALRNDEPWIANPWRGLLYAVSNDGRETMSILMDVFDEKYTKGEHLWRERISFAGVPKRLGTYPLPGRVVQRDTEQRNYFLTSDHGDVLGLVYVLDKSEDGFISIDAYDRSSCTIQGTFALSVIREEPGGAYPYVDTLRFSEGRFHTHVVTWPGAK